MAAGLSNYVFEVETYENLEDERKRIADEDVDPEFEEAKEYLQTPNESGLSLYDHLKRVLINIFDERPENVIDIFEDLSREAKAAAIKANLENLEEEEEDEEEEESMTSLHLDKLNVDEPVQQVITIETTPLDSVGSQLSVEDKSSYASFVIGKSSASLSTLSVVEPASKEMVVDKYAGMTESEIQMIDKSTEVAMAQIQQKLFMRGEDEEEDAGDDEEKPLSNIMESAYFFEQAGVGLNREEMFRIFLSIKKLLVDRPLQHARFWGKIFGLEQNYLIVEAEGDEEDEEEEEEEEEVEEEEEDEDEEEEEDDIPKINYKPPPPTPKEDPQVGTNKKTYFVCNDPGKPWIKMPHVTPQQIYVARRIKKFFTGRFDQPIISYPPFPGNEMNYLRAQIARISASSQVSPIGYFNFDEEEDEPEDGAQRSNFVINEEYTPAPMRELADPSGWVHHVQHILPQGRTTWWNPLSKGEDEEEEAEEEEEETDAKGNRKIKPRPEVGPPLLTPLSEDLRVSKVCPWNVQLTSKLVPQHAIAVVHSCLWPGAHAYAAGKTFENIYIGWGHKYSPLSYSPVAPPPLQTEFPEGPGIVEMTDPTVDEEAAARAAEEEEEEEEVENEDEDDEGGEDDEDA